MNSPETQMVLLPTDQFNTLLKKLDKLEQRVRELGVEPTMRKPMFGVAAEAMRLSQGGLLSPAHVSRILGYHRDTLYRKIKSNPSAVPPFVFDGKRYKISIDNFMSWYHKKFTAKVSGKGYNTRMLNV